MNHPLRDAFTVLMRQLLEQVIILHQHRPARTGGKRVLIIRNGISSSRGKSF